MRALFLALMFASFATAQNSRFADLTQHMERTRSELKLKGAALVIGKADGRMLYREFFGEFSSATVIPVASVTKWWSAATIETLVDRKLIDLDRPISAYLKDAPPDKSSLTIRELLSHTSGIGKAGVGPYKDCGTLDEAARFLLGLPLFAPHGTAFQYNGAAMQVAGRIAEIVTGKSWAEIFQQAIVGPLELKSTSYGDKRNPILGGGISTSADEIAKFLLMLSANGTYHGKQILSPKTVRDMEHNIAGRAKEFRSVTNGPLTFAGYNAGNWCEVQDAAGQCLRVSSYGANGSYPWIDRQRGIYGVFFAMDNLYRDEPYFKTAREMAERIVDRSSKR